MWRDQQTRELIKEELIKHLGLENEEQWQDALGILTGVVTADFGGIGRVEFTLTDEERAEWLAAVIKAQQSCRSIAECMGPGLEELVCGNKPERYRKL